MSRRQPLLPLLAVAAVFLLASAPLAAAPAGSDAPPGAAAGGDAEPRQAAGEEAARATTTGDQAPEPRPMTLVGGPLLFGVEAHQVVMRTGEGADFLPAIALRARREIGVVTVGARLDAALSPGGCAAARSAPCRSATVLATGQPEILFSLAPDSLTSAYLAASGGVAVVRFDGRISPGDEREALSKWGYIMGLRFGVEWLRHAAMRVDAFVQADIPFFETSSNESDLMETYTPSARAGIGVSF
jgi:hypothetical protein